MSDETVLYRIYWNKLEEFKVLKRTPKTVTARSDWTRMFRTSQIGVDVFWTALEAWEAAAALTRDEIERAKYLLQDARTQLGMIESCIKRLAQPQAADAVDPVVGRDHETSTRA